MWFLPSGHFLAGLGAGTVIAYGVSLIALPFMAAATRVDAVRFE